MIYGDKFLLAENDVNFLNETLELDTKKHNGLSIKIRRIGEAIKNAIDAAIKFIKDLFEKFVNFFKNLKLNKLNKKLSGIRYNDIKNLKISKHEKDKYFRFSSDSFLDLKKEIEKLYDHLMENSASVTDQYEILDALKARFERVDEMMKKFHELNIDDSKDHLMANWDKGRRVSDRRDNDTLSSWLTEQEFRMIKNDIASKNFAELGGADLLKKLNDAIDSLEKTKKQTIKIMDSEIKDLDKINRGGMQNTENYAGYEALSRLYKVTLQELRAYKLLSEFWGRQVKKMVKKEINVAVFIAKHTKGLSSNGNTDDEDDINFDDIFDEVNESASISDVNIIVENAWLTA